MWIICKIQEIVTDIKVNISDIRRENQWTHLWTQTTPNSHFTPYDKIKNSHVICDDKITKITPSTNK